MVDFASGGGPSAWEQMQYGGSPGYAAPVAPSTPPMYGNSAEMAGAGGAIGTMAPQQSWWTRPPNPELAKMLGTVGQGITSAVGQSRTPYWSHPITSSFTAPLPGKAFREQQTIDTRQRGQDLVADQAQQRTQLGQDRLDFDIGQAKTASDLNRQRMASIQRALSPAPAQTLGVAETPLPGAQGQAVGGTAPPPTRYAQFNQAADRRLAEGGPGALEDAAKIRAMGGGRPPAPPTSAPERQMVRKYGPDWGQNPQAMREYDKLLNKPAVNIASGPMKISTPGQGTAIATPDSSEPSGWRVDQVVEGNRTKAQANSEKFASRQVAGAREYNRLVQEVGGDESQLVPGRLATYLDAKYPEIANELRNPMEKQVEAAKMMWLEPLIRDDSGAAVPEIEVQRAKWTYFPRPGEDSQAILDMKQRLRTAAQDAVASGQKLGYSDRAERDATIIAEMKVDEKQDGDTPPARGTIKVRKLDGTMEDRPASSVVLDADYTKGPGG